MNSYYLVKHSDKKFVYHFNIDIGLWVIGGWVFMSKTQTFSKLGHHEILKMATVISDDRLWDFESCDDMIEY